MSEPFLAEVKLVGFEFAPRGWGQCDGQILPINQNQSLYSLLGTTYGGDGRTTFGLPDLRGRVPLHVGTGNQLGRKAGEETHTLTEREMPSHTHVVNGTNNSGSETNPTDALHATTGGGRRPVTPYAFEEGDANLTAMQETTVQQNADGADIGGQGHDNMQPFLALYFVIALQGLFPSRN